MSSINYFSITREVDPYNATFNMIVGARGTGKTYSALWEKIMNNETGNSILMRRTQTELDFISDTKNKSGKNPFKTLNNDKGTDWSMVKESQNLALILDDDCAVRGYGLALSSIANTRGMDYSDVNLMVYDEFIPQKSAKRMRGEANAFLNAYETVNRNRELKGEKPVKVYCLANSNDIYNPIFKGLGLVDRAERMIHRGQKASYMKDRDILLYFVDAQDVTNAKSETALYKLAKGTEFADMALNNEFAYNDFSNIAYRNIKEYVPICHIEEMYVWKHKSNGSYYITYHKAYCTQFYYNDSDIIKFRLEVGRFIYGAFVYGKVTFESYDLKGRFLEIVA